MNSIKDTAARLFALLTPRKTVQLISLAIIFTAAVQLYLFAHGIRQDGAASAFTYRPAVLEGFLPIGALMAAKYWLATGVYDPVHPAALTILLIAIIISLLFRRSFCSWFCPIGTVSEWLGKLGAGLFKKDLRLPAFLHYPLLGLKFILLAAFIYYFVIQLPADFIAQFMNQPYYLTADIAILDFWRDISTTALIFIVTMTVLSVIYKNFWCRYFCPYGALLSLWALFSPLGITRDQEQCINCGGCSRACPNGIKVAARSRVNSVECTACLNCTSACPRENVLAPRFFNLRMKPMVLGAIILTVYFGSVLLAHLSGNWQTVLTFGDYVQLLNQGSAGQ